MKRTITALAIVLLASPVAALERSPGGPLGRDASDHQAAPERGERMSGGRDRAISGRDSPSRGYVQHDHSGHGGDRE